ncbi:MAG: 4-demethylwyosine synthase TYW1 [archaeon]
MMDAKLRRDFKRQGYRLVGSHSAVKVCLWCKRAILDEDVCYKNTFYGINPNRCIQASVSITNCYLRCEFCWRCLDYTEPKEIENPDDPKFILDGLIAEQKEYLQGFRGNKKTDKEKFEEAMDPKHIALSLAGDATFYPKLPELIDEIHSRGMTSFVVTNGLKPDMMRKLLNHKPTQMYITIAAPDKETYLTTCNPLIPDAWERLQESLKILQKFSRRTIRLTLVKGLNMVNPEGYANLLRDLDVDFIELKAAMPMGYAQYRMTYESMPWHEEIRDFAKQICGLTDFKIIDEKENSRVVLLMREDSPDRKLRIP